VSLDLADGGVAERDLVIQFSHEPLVHAAQKIPEFAELLPLLERARYGIEFFGLSERAQAHWWRAKQSHGLPRLVALCDYLCDLLRCTDYRLLSSVMMQGEDDATGQRQINSILDRITADVSQPMSAAELAAELEMSDSSFSRFFRRATGNTFTDFLSRVRVSRACQLLMETDRQVTQICYEVGFNNVANFNRRFLEIKGMTPTEFRRQAAKRFTGSKAS
jgi:AraC-like DNA-binding protein